MSRWSTPRGPERIIQALLDSAPDDVDAPLTRLQALLISAIAANLAAAPNLRHLQAFNGNIDAARRAPSPTP